MSSKDASHSDYWIELPGTVPSVPGGAARPSRRSSSGAPAQGWDDAPSFVISVAARMVGMHAQTLRYYERAGLVNPARSKGNIRLYRPSDIDRLRLIQKLIADHGVNLAGVELVLQMEERLQKLQGRLDALADERRRTGTDAAAGS